MSLTKEEITGLSKLTEGQQIVFLNSSGILEFGSYSHIESLADCAGRLWKEAVKNHKKELDHAICFVGGFMSDKVEKDDPEGSMNFGDWFLYYADPIHRIQAALLAGEGKV